MLDGGRGSILQSCQSSVNQGSCSFQVWVGFFFVLKQIDFPFVHDCLPGLSSDDGKSDKDLVSQRFECVNLRCFSASCSGI